MPSWMIQCGYVAYADDDDPVVYEAPCGSTTFGDAGRLTEACRQWLVRDSYTLDRLYVRVYFNNLAGSCTFRSRVNGAYGNQSVSVGAGVTGTFEDNVNSDALVSGDLVDTRVDATPGAVGVEIDFSVITYRLTTAMNNTPVIGCNGTYTRTTATTRYSPIMSYLSLDTTEAQAEYTFREAATLSNLRVYVSANTRDDATTIRLRKNTGNGNQVVTFAAGVSGAQEDAANTDAIASGDEVDYQFAIGGSGSITIESICIKSTSAGRQTANAAMYTGAEIDDGVTGYLCVEGSISGYVGAEATYQSKVRTPLTAKNGFAYLRFNSLNGALALTLRKNSGDAALSITVGAGLTGKFEDLVNSEDYSSEDDLIDWKLAAGGSSGTAVVNILGFQQDQYSGGGGGSSPSASIANKLVGAGLI